MGDKIANFIIKQRYLVATVVLIVTFFFLYHARNIKVQTLFSELLPQNHQYIKTHNEIRHSFGGAATVLIEVSVKDGDIFNYKTLSKIKYITDELTYFPAVDRYKVLSIGAKKVKDIKATAWGIETTPLMWPEVPKTRRDIEELKFKVYSNDQIYGILVSLDSKAALIYADFFEDEISYERVFEKLMEIRKVCEDDNTIVSVGGEPIVYGYVYNALGETGKIFLITFGAMIALLSFYTRNFQMSVLPLTSALLCATWGLGFARLIGYHLDPLILVVPMLISARALSHSVQFNERYLEELEVWKDNQKACHATVKALFIPGLAGVITDAAGILLIGLIPIALLRNLGIVSTFWALSVLPMVLLFNPVILLLLRQGRLIPKTERKFEVGIAKRLLGHIGNFSVSKRKLVLTVTAVITVLAGICSLRLSIGDANPGTPILWPNSRYNQDIKRINEKFPGVDQLYIVVKGKKEYAIKEPVIQKAMEDFQRYFESNSNAKGTISYNNIIRRFQGTLHLGDPKWEYTPNTINEVGALIYMLEANADPDDFDKYSTAEWEDANIQAFFKDHRGDTVKEAIATAKEFIAQYPTMKEAEFRLAGGLIGIMAAVNEEIERSQIALLILALGTTALFCAVSFRSLAAGILLIIPLTIANLLVFAYMAIKGIGLNINTLPVASIAIGIGVDYGIYLMGRIREEYSFTSDLKMSIVTAVETTGKAITFTAMTIIFGVVFWYFSSLRFQAEMGLMLAIVTFLHLLGTLFLLSSMVALVKPKFICGNKSQ